LEGVNRNKETTMKPYSNEDPEAARIDRATQQTRRPRSADFQSAVSPISNRQTARHGENGPFFNRPRYEHTGTRRLEALRHSRLEICATGLARVVPLLCSLCWLLFPPGAFAQSSSTSISFQGALNGPGGAPLANGNYSLTFRFYSNAVGGVAIGETNVPGVTVAGGVASTAIPVQPAWFDGSTRYLGIGVSSNGTVLAGELSPRVLVSMVPYSAYSYATRGILVDSNDRVVIGNGTPKATLNVARPTRGEPSVPGDGHIWLAGVSGGGELLLGVNNRGSFLQSFQQLPLALNPAGSNVGVGTDRPQALLDVNGTTRTSVLQITGGADLAEHLSVTDSNPQDEFKVEPGMVVSIDSTGARKFKLSDEPYDRKRVGIISGGNGVKPGLVLRDEGNPSADGEHPIALTGQVWCRADAAFGPIAPGDLLTTSATPGHAMRVSDFDRARFAVLGQALTVLKEGRGWVRAQ
jgi:hypothetical protein